jgi:hypothetical protein
MQSLSMIDTHAFEAFTGKLSVGGWFPSLAVVGKQAFSKAGPNTVVVLEGSGARLQTEAVCLRMLSDRTCVVSLNFERNMRLVQ